MKELIEHSKGNISLIILAHLPHYHRHHPCMSQNQSQEKYRVWQARVLYTKPA